LGGDGIYAAWTLCYNEDSIPEVARMVNRMKLSWCHHDCFNAEKIQPQLMQFTTNQKDFSEMDKHQDILDKTMRYFS
jgi:hypothetical protein